MSRKYIFFIFFITIFLIGVTQLRLRISYASSNESVGASIILRPLVQVLITGAIETPGIYRLPKGTRIAQLIEMAGGLLPDARVNKGLLKKSVVDGSRLHISTTNEVNQIKNINLVIEKSTLTLETVTFSQLSKLPGIGKKLAKRIIEYRNIYGKGIKLEDLKKVDGIGFKKLKKIKPYFK